MLSPAVRSLRAWCRGGQLVRPIVKAPRFSSSLCDAQTCAHVDEYFEGALLEEDAVLEQVLRRSEKEGLPPHAVSPLQGQLLHQLVVMRSASTVLELGTLGGYSTIWFARAVRKAAAIATATTGRTPRVVTLEANSHHAAVARDNLQLAKVQDVVTLLEGPALDSMQALAASDEAFDVVFIDADKPNNPAYLHAALKLSRPGTVIIGDNVVRGGNVLDSSGGDANVKGVRSFVEQLGELKSQGVLLSSTAVQTVGCKGWDGFTLSIVK